MKWRAAAAEVTLVTWEAGKADEQQTKGCQQPVARPVDRLEDCFLKRRWFHRRSYRYALEEGCPAQPLYISLEQVASASVSQAREADRRRVPG